MVKYVIKKKEVNIIDEHKISKFSEYHLPFNKFSMGVSIIDGRYPLKGFDVDTTIEAAWYVESGKGEIFLKGKVYKMEAGDMIFVPKNEKFWIDGKKLKLVVVSSPKWYASQHKHIE